MRKFLLASVATLGTAGLASAVYAQAPGAPIPQNPVQGGWVSAPLASPPVGANNNNNKQAPALPGNAANPTPGTIVVHFNGFVVTEFTSAWTSVDSRIAAPVTYNQASTSPPSFANVAVGNIPGGSQKLMPQEIGSYARLFAGVDGMAANGLRYGSGMEIRQNFAGQVSSTSSSGASGYSSLETLFVRRAFTYVAGEQWGIVRLGQADGLISLFDSGVTTFQFLPTGNLNGGDNQNIPGSSPPFVYLAVAGNEYANAKAVYLSPQIAGFDFGIQYAPNTANGQGVGTGFALNNSLTGSGVGTGQGCSVAKTGCPTLSTGSGIQDGSRMINEWAFGGRYQGVFGGVGVLAYAVGEFGSHAQFSGFFATPAAQYSALGNPTPVQLDAAAGVGPFVSRYTGNFKNLAIGSGGIALTYAGFTFGGNVIGGNMNGQLGLQPQGGAPLFGYLLGAKYINGPFTIGIVGEEFWDQGNVNLTGISQNRGRGLDAGFSYTIAPGFTAFAEYLWNDQQQNFNNFNSGNNLNGTAQGSFSKQNNNYHGQSIVIGDIISF
ncbi:MAG TPA: hypothetical protein VKI44_30945 [Acetobacteraceae bacterium]|nr:hypothetical protein [Acetobacteraceae bacterium]